MFFEMLFMSRFLAAAPRAFSDLTAVDTGVSISLTVVPQMTTSASNRLLAS